MEPILANLPIRPAPKSGESLWGYVYRLHSANGHFVPRKIQSALRVLYELKDRRTVMAAYALLRSCLPASELDRHWWLENRIASWWKGPATRNWIGMRWDHMRICPHCVKDDGFHHALWELPLVHACPAHGCWLVCRCPSCGNPLTWRLLCSKGRCKCGRRYSAMQADAAPEAMIELAQFIGSAVDIQRAERDILSTLRPWGPIGLQGSYQVVQQLHGLRKSIVDNILRRPSRTWPIPAGYGTTKARTAPHAWEGRQLCRWPEDFQMTLLRLARRRWRRSTRTLIVLGPNSKVFKLIEHIGARCPDGWLDDPIRAALAELISRYRLPVLGTRRLVLFNPMLSDLERRQRIRAFAHWWSEVIDTAPIEAPSPVSSRRTLGHPTYDAERERLALALTTELMEHALRGTTAARFHEMVNTWPGPMPRMADCTPEEWPSFIASGLLRMKVDSLGRLSEAYGVPWNVED